MHDSVERLKKELGQFLDLLNQASLFSFTAEERQSLHTGANELSQKLASIESSFLTIGLLGGTGVGKSTLMNALAGAEIASTSHRRPHTDQVLIYRHGEANALPALSLEDIPYRELTHEAKSIKQILLCDLPDFDSLMGEHRKQVLGFMEHLDVLVWVTSPEKYADGCFYEFLRLAPKAKQNFYFVLNKVDLVFEGETLQRGYEKMARVERSFREHIMANGIGEPILYAFSAEKALDGDPLAPWNQFPAFRQQIFQQRDVKQVTAIKAANVDVEVQQLVSVLQKEMLNLESFQKVLEGSVREVEAKRGDWVQGGQETIDLWLEKHIKPAILFYRADPICLVGPGYSLAMLHQQWQQRLAGVREFSRDPSSFIIPEDMAFPFRRRLEWLEDRVHHQVLRQNLPASFQEQVHEIFDIAKTFEDLKERFSHIVALRVAQASLPRFWGFKALQSLTYLLLLAFFLLAVGGETAWLAILEAPGWTSVFGLLVSGIDTLFSPKGLAALGSYGLLNLFFAFRFYGRYKKLSRYRAQQVIKSLEVELGKVWEKNLDAVVNDLNRFKDEIRSQISGISAFKEKRNGP
ncbi:MAG: 50S ribosome-binding GTPase [Deltaproteobacteria bacterium]|jgi:GTP-binding protein EngB required for normal cell division